jgi:hypothetical protein
LGKKKFSYSIVQDLPLGEGKVIVMTQKGNKIRVKGEIIELPNGQKHLQVTKNKKGNLRFINRSFGPRTKIEVEEWKPKQKL